MFAYACVCGKCVLVVCMRKLLVASGGFLGVITIQDCTVLSTTAHL